MNNVPVITKLTNDFRGQLPKNAEERNQKITEKKTKFDKSNCHLTKIMLEENHSMEFRWWKWSIVSCVRGALSHAKPQGDPHKLHRQSKPEKVCISIVRSENRKCIIYPENFVDEERKAQKVNK